MTDIEQGCQIEIFYEDDIRLWGWLCFTHGAEFGGFLNRDEAEDSSTTCALYLDRPRRRFQTVQLPEEDVT